MSIPAVTVQMFKRLRRKMLELLYVTRGAANGGWLGGGLLRDMLGDRSSEREKCSSELQQITLLRDLVLNGYAKERDARVYKDTPFGLDYLDFKITAKGVSLIEGSIKPDADIDDNRILLAPRT